MEEPNIKMNVVLKRYESSDHGTFGKIVINDKTFHTLELPWKNNKKNISCIPTGTYECELYPSSRFGVVYILKNVPGRSGILIHPGNFGGDSELGFKTDINGCILLGEKRGELGGQKCVLNSRAAIKEFMNLFSGGGFTLEIKKG